MPDLLKFITCGSVDDGKSTLIGHMLYDAKLIYADQKQALELDSKVGSNGGKIDYSLLLDGLMAEREQGITIDVAYRYFTTGKRAFIVADCPGHEQYTRNMAVGSSFADLAVILVDASKGLSVQTRRHTMICAFMGIKHVVLVVNKMDLVHYSQELFETIQQEFKNLCAQYEMDSIQVIPCSATEGDNITQKSLKSAWYQGPTLLNYLETIEIDAAPGAQAAKQSFIMPVQRVCRPNAFFRGFQGEIAAGEIMAGQEVTVLPTENTARVKQIYWGDKEVAVAGKGQPVTITLDSEIDVSRGCVLLSGSSLELANMFNATILWMGDQRMTPGSSYLIKCGTATMPVNIMQLKHKLNINTGKKEKADYAYKNDIVACDLTSNEPMVFDAFKNNKTLGSFILVDRITNMTAACGIINYALRRASNLHWQQTDITREIRARQKGQKPLVLWFTGLSGAGKSTLANELEKRLVAMGKHTMLLDGDNVRQGLNKNLSFSEKDRVENIRRIAEVAKLMNDAGLIVLTAFISPYLRDRQYAREIIGDSFVEIYVSTPLEVCEEKDVKGLYKKARDGEIPEFTGISSPYEPPEYSEIEIDTSRRAIDDSVDFLMAQLKKYI